MDFSTITAKVHNIHERTIEDCIAAAYFAKTAKDKGSLQNSKEQLERFVVMPHMGGYTVDHLLRVLFIVEGHISRHFKDSNSYDKDMKEIDKLKKHLRKVQNDTK